MHTNPSWYDPDVQLANSGDLTLAPTVDANFEVRRNGESFTRIGAFSEIVSAKIRAGFADIQVLTAQTLTAVTANFGELTTNSLAVVTDNITIAGQNITDFITSKILSAWLLISFALRGGVYVNTGLSIVLNSCSESIIFRPLFWSILSTILDQYRQ